PTAMDADPKSKGPAFRLDFLADCRNQFSRTCEDLLRGIVAPEKNRHDRVTDKLIHVAARRDDGVRLHGEEPVELADKKGSLTCFAPTGETAQIGKEHDHLLFHPLEP